MFDYISGKVTAVSENRVVVDCGGVGFSICASSYACEKFSRQTEAKILTYLAVREDALELYGFCDESERRLFLLLISVSGVGAKLAIAVLSGLPASTLLSAIAGGDTAALSSIKGVGKKTAERIVLELKAKVEAMGVVGAAVDTPSAVDGNAVNALIGLGYDRKEAESAVKKCAKPNMTTEEIIRTVLQGL